MRLATSERRVPDFIALFMFISVGECKVKKTDNCKVRVEVLNRGIGVRETGEYYLCYLMSCDDAPLFRCVTRIQAIHFFRKVKYNLLYETI